MINATSSACTTTNNIVYACTLTANTDGLISAFLFTGVVTDLALLENAESNTLSVMVDNTPPPITTIIPSPMIPSTTPLIGTGESGATVVIMDHNGSVLGTGVVDGSGNFSILTPTMTSSTP